MNRELILNCVAHFTWMFDKNFFVETPYGNFVWSDPDYGGDNTFKKFKASYEEFNDSYGKGHFGRDKGRHVVSSYCGNEIKIMGY